MSSRTAWATARFCFRKTKNEEKEVGERRREREGYEENRRRGGLEEEGED